MLHPVDGAPDTDLIGAVLPAMMFHHITSLNDPVDQDFGIAVIDHLVLPALDGAVLYLSGRRREIHSGKMVYPLA